MIDVLRLISYNFTQCCENYGLRSHAVIVIHLHIISSFFLHTRYSILSMYFFRFCMFFTFIFFYSRDIDFIPFSLVSDVGQFTRKTKKRNEWKKSRWQKKESGKEKKSAKKSSLSFNWRSKNYVSALSKNETRDEWKIE